MKSIGKTYLIKIEPQKEEVVNGIFIPQTASSRDTVYYIGRIIDYGSGFTEEEKTELLPIGTKVILDYRKSVSENKIRLNFGEEIFYVYEPENILAIIEEEEEE